VCLMCRLRAAPTKDLGLAVAATARLPDAQIVSIILARPTYPIHCLFTPKPDRSVLGLGTSRRRRNHIKVCVLRLKTIAVP
jgi:hypothetical protein